MNKLIVFLGDWRFDKKTVNKKEVKKYAREIFF